MANKMIRTIFSVEGAQKWERDVKRITDAQKGLRSELAKAEANYKETGDKTKYLESRQKALNGLFQKQQEKIKKLTQALDAAKKKTGETSAETAKFKRDLNYAEVALSSIKRELDQTNKELFEQQSKLIQTGRQWQESGKNIQETGKKVASTGTKMTLGLTLPLVAMGKSAVNTATNFETGMSQLAGSLGKPAKEMDSLRKLALDMGADTIFSATEASQAMTELAKAGMTEADIKGGVLAETLTLAAAGSLDLASAATYTVNAMSTFGLGAKDASVVTTALSGGANASTASVESLALALSQVGPGAKNAGMSINETVAALSAFDAAGIKGSDAGTSLKTMLQRLVPQTDKAAEAMEQYGLSFTDSTGKIDDMATIAEKLQKRLGGLSEAEKTRALTTIFGSDATRAATVLMNGGRDTIEKYIAATKDQAAAQKLADSAMGSTAKIMEELSGAVETAGIQVGEALLPIIRDVAKWIGEVAESFANLDPKTQKLIISIIALVAAMGPVLTVGGNMTKLFGKLKEGAGSLIEKLGSGDLGLAGKLGLVGAALGILAIAITDTINRMNAIDEKTKELVESSEALKKSQDSTFSEMTANKQVTTELVNELETLRNKENKTAEDMARMHAIVNQLNGMYNGLNLSIDEQTGALNISSNALRKNIEQRQAAIEIMATQKAQLEQLTQAKKYEAELNNNDLYQKAKAAGKLNSEGKYDTTTLKLGSLANGTLSASLEDINSMNALVDGLNKAEASAKSLGEQATELTKKYGPLKEGTDALSDSTGNLGNTTAESGAQMTAAMSGYSEALSKTAEEQKAQLEKLEGTTQQVFGGMGSLMDDGMKQMDLSLSEATENLQQQIEDWKTWKANIDEISKRVPVDVAEYLSSLGPSASGMIAEMTEASDDELNLFRDVFREKMRLSEEEAKNQLGILPESVSQIISDTAEAAEVSGLLMSTAGGRLGAEMDTEFYTQISAMPSKTKSTLQNTTAAVESEMGAAGKAGANVGGKVAEQYKQNVSDATGAAAAMSTNVSAVLQQMSAAFANGAEVGKSMGRGVVFGLNCMEAYVDSAANRIINSAAGAMRAAAQIHSPSKVGKSIGENLGSSVGIGLEEAVMTVDQSSKKLIEQSIKAMKNASFDSPEIRFKTGAAQSEHRERPTVSLSQSAITAMGNEMVKAIDGKLTVSLSQRELGRVVKLK